MKDEYICYRTQCKYHSGNVSGSDGSCNYFFITGETKTSLGEADITRKCGLFRTGKTERRVQPIVVSAKRPPDRTPKAPVGTAGRKKYDWAQFRALWEEGKRDAEIAREIGCNADTVRRWRRRAGLAPNAFRYVIDTEKLKKCWAEGLNDPQIAERLGVSRPSVYKARRKLELPPNAPPRRRTP